MLARDHSPAADLGSSGRPPAALRPLHFHLGESALPLVHVFSLLAHHLLPLECRRDSKTVHFQLGPGRRQSAHTLSGLLARCGGFVPPSLLGHQQVVIHHSVGGTLHAGEIGIGRCYTSGLHRPFLWGSTSCQTLFHCCCHPFLFPCIEGTLLQRLIDVDVGIA